MDHSPYSTGVKPGASALDIERLIGDVAQRHDVLLRRDDPILVTVTLNERIIERALARLTAVVEASEVRTITASARSRWSIIFAPQRGRRLHLLTHREGCCGKTAWRLTVLRLHSRE